MTATDLNTLSGMEPVQPVARRRPITRPIGWEGFWIRYGSLITFVVNLSIFFSIWEVVARSGTVSRLLLPPVSEIITETIKLFSTGLLAKNLSFTAINFVVGFAISVVIGIPLGLALGASKALDRILGPYLWALYSTPRLALLPLITVAIGFGWESKVLLIFLGAVFMIIMNTWAGVKTVDTSLIRAAKVFGANRLQIFTQVVVPYTMPFIAEGLRLGITRAIVTTLVAEMLASSQGIGYLVMRAADAFNTAQMFSLILMLVIFSVGAVSIMRRIESWLAPWRDVINV